MSKDLELFEEISGKIFAICLDQFPLMQDLSMQDVGLSGHEESVMFKCTFIWLKENGYIRYEQITLGDEPIVTFVQLTKDGLALMNTEIKPHSQSTKKKAGTILIKLFKNGSGEAAKEAIRHAVHMLFGLAF